MSKALGSSRIDKAISNSGLLPASKPKFHLEPQVINSSTT